MPLTRSQKQSLKNSGTDLFEPVLQQRGGARPKTRSQGDKRPAITESTTTKKKKRTAARREVSLQPKATKATNDDDESTLLKQDWQSDTTASTVVATVTPSAARVRRSPLSSSERPQLPEKVVDIFDANLGDELKSTVWETPQTLMQNYITGFMHTYSTEYHDYLKQSEDREFEHSFLGEKSEEDLKYRLQPEFVDFDAQLPWQPHINVKMRHVLIAWLAEVAAEFKLSQAAYHLSVSMLDELLLLGPSLEEYKKTQREISAGVISDDEGEDKSFLIKPRNFQAIGCACIWIASKIEDVNPPTSDQLSFISDNACNADSLLEFETDIMHLLGFRPLRITPIHFLDLHERASQASTAGHSLQDVKRIKPQFHYMFQYLLQLGRPNYQLRLEKPSLVAAAACFLARATLGLRSEDGLIWTPTLEYYSGYSQKDLTAPVMLLLCSFMEAEYLNKPLFTIYKSSERCRVSLKTAPLIDSLGFTLPFNLNEHDDVVDIVDERKRVFLDEE